MRFVLSLLLVVAFMPVQEPSESALLEAARTGRIEDLKGLLAAGGDVDARSVHGETCLHLAADQGNLAMVTLLVEAGAAIDPVDRYGWTPLMLAADGGALDVVGYLLEKGADVNAAEGTGTTSLMWASAGNHINIVKTLIRGQAEINVADDAGRTALDYVKYTDHREMIKLLRALGAKDGTLTRGSAKEIDERRQRRDQQKQVTEFEHLDGAEVYLDGDGGLELVPGGSEVVDLFKEAQNHFRQGRYSQVLIPLLTADRKAAGQCRPCLDLMVDLHIINKDLESATEDLVRLEALSEDRTRLGELNRELGIAYFERAPRQHDDLVRAEAYLRAALDLSGDEDNTARFYLGRTYEETDRESESIALFKAYLEREPDSPLAEGLQLRIETMTAQTGGAVGKLDIRGLDGNDLDLATHRGKVVLLDFWTTWCGPCKASQPTLKRLHKKNGDSPFVLIGISGDRHADVVRPYVAKNRIKWPIYMDPHTAVSRKIFGVKSYPTFVLLDHKGAVIWTGRGWSSRMARELKTNIARALRQVE